MLHYFKQFNRWFDRIFMVLGGAFLLGMVAVTVANVILRREIFSVPVEGATEITALFGAVMIASALALTQSRGGHVSVNILTQNFPKRMQLFFGLFNSLISLLFFLLLGVKLFQLAQLHIAAGDVTETLQWIMYPFTFYITAAVFALTLILLEHLCSLILEIKEVA